MSVITNLIGFLNICVGYNQDSDLIIQNAKSPPPISPKNESPINTETSGLTKNGQTNKIE